jgi:hypothetical protein
MTGQSASSTGEPGRPATMVEAHALLASREHVLEDRRGLYRMAVRLVGAGTGLSDVDLDHPIRRFAIGELLAGRVPAAGFRLPDLAALADNAAAGQQPAPVVASRPDSAELFAPALRSVAAEAGVSGRPLGLITRADGERFTAALDAVGSGLELARSLVPDLMADLLGHVAVIGVLDPARSATVVSASSRHVPGLVLLRPGSALDIAESLVHEIAHQRLFDLAITRDMLRTEADGRAGFRPSWRPSVWPIEQTLAAFHAYACLAELAATVPPADLASALGPHSVLPDAPQRAIEIGDWLDDNSHLLGPDAIRLVRSVLGRPPAPADPFTSAPELEPGRVFRAAESDIIPMRDGRHLVGIPGEPPRLFWLDADASAVLDILRVGGTVPFAGIVREFGDLVGIRDAFARVSNALDTLVLTDLAAVS